MPFCKILRDSRPQHALTPSPTPNDTHHPPSKHPQTEKNKHEHLWPRRARPAFLYVMYAILLWAIPTGIISAFSPVAGMRMTEGIIAYLSGLPEPLYALFGTGYIGYTAARQWGKINGSDR